MRTEPREAGRELDARVQRRVFGGVVLTNLGDVNGDGYGVGSLALPLPRFSTNIEAAWQVVEEMAELWDVEVYRYHEVSGEPLWVCKIGNLVDHEPVWHVAADTAPLAICLAALEAVSADRPDL